MAGPPNEKSATASIEGGDPSLEKPTALPLEDSEDLQALAARGHVATDQFVSFICSWCRAIGLLGDFA